VRGGIYHLDLLPLPDEASNFLERDIAASAGVVELPVAILFDEDRIIRH
jgi:hypothetical protein